MDTLAKAIKCRLAHRIRYAAIVFDGNGPDNLTAQATPDFTQFNHQISDDCVVYDIFSLAASAFAEGNFWILTCECGCPDDTGIEAPIQVSHESDTICWNIPLWQYPDIIRGRTNAREGDWLKLIFERNQYLQAAQSMLEDIQCRLKNPTPFRMLKEADCTRAYDLGKQLSGLKADFPDCRFLPIETFNPYDYNQECTLLAAATLKDLLK